MMIPATDDEKYDKIRTERAQSRKYVFGFAIFLACFAAYAILFRSAPASAIRISENQISAESIQAELPIKLPPAQTHLSIADLEDRVKELDAQVREIKKTGIITETDPKALMFTKHLQEETRRLLLARYGKYPAYRVKVDLEFKPSIPDYQEKGKDGELIIEMAPISLIPVSVYNFLEIARTWQGGVFHRNAGHVLQATTQSTAVKQALPFQEYSKNFPHVLGTTGYCGRPSGPCWYISIRDNSVTHGPGSQQKKNPYEADANFGKIVKGMDDTVPRIHSTPGSGWLNKDDQIKIVTMTVLVPSGPNGEFQPWKE